MPKAGEPTTPTKNRKKIIQKVEEQTTSSSNRKRKTPSKVIEKVLMTKQIDDNEDDGTSETDADTVYMSDAKTPTKTKNRTPVKRSKKAKKIHTDQEENDIEDGDMSDVQIISSRSVVKDEQRPRDMDFTPSKITTPSTSMKEATPLKVARTKNSVKDTISAKDEKKAHMDKKSATKRPAKEASAKVTQAKVTNDKAPSSSASKAHDHRKSAKAIKGKDVERMTREKVVKTEADKKAKTPDKIVSESVGNMFVSPESPQDEIYGFSNTEKDSDAENNDIDSSNDDDDQFSDQPDPFVRGPSKPSMSREAAKKKAFPEYERYTTPIEDIKSMKAILLLSRIDRMITDKSSPRYRWASGYRRHAQAPYAYSYRGLLHKSWYKHMESLDTNGRRILTDAEIRRIGGTKYQTWRQKHPDHVPHKYANAKQFYAATMPTKAMQELAGGIPGNGRYLKTTVEAIGRSSTTAINRRLSVERGRQTEAEVDESTDESEDASDSLPESDSDD